MTQKIAEYLYKNRYELNKYEKIYKNCLFKIARLLNIQKPGLMVIVEELPKFTMLKKVYWEKENELLSEKILNLHNDYDVAFLNLFLIFVI